jgi:hypothetical protein
VVIKNDEISDLIERVQSTFGVKDLAPDVDEVVEVSWRDTLINLKATKGLFGNYQLKETEDGYQISLEEVPFGDRILDGFNLGVDFSESIPRGESNILAILTQMFLDRLESNLQRLANESLRQARQNYWRYGFSGT